MYFFQPKFRILERKTDLIVVETATGRSVFVFLVAIFLFFQTEYILYTGLLLLIFVFTYSRRWILDRRKNTICSIKGILGIVYEETETSMEQVVILAVGRRPNAGGGGSNYRLQIKTKDGKVIPITTRGRCSDLKPIIGYFRLLLPEAVEYVPHEDCLKEEPFFQL